MKCLAFPQVARRNVAINLPQRVATRNTCFTFGGIRVLNYVLEKNHAHSKNHYAPMGKHMPPLYRVIWLKWGNQDTPYEFAWFFSNTKIEYSYLAPDSFGSEHPDLINLISINNIRTTKLR